MDKVKVKFYFKDGSSSEAIDVTGWSIQVEGNVNIVQILKKLQYVGNKNGKEVTFQPEDLRSLEIIFE